MKHPDLPVARVMTIVFHRPWLLGWCRWELYTTLRFESGREERSSLFATNWKWRGRRAFHVEANLDTDVDFYGPSMPWLYESILP